MFMKDKLIAFIIAITLINHIRYGLGLTMSGQYEIDNESDWLTTTTYQPMTTTTSNSLTDSDSNGGI